jgi:TetR/AcrR family transcriptional regulator, lmrAB and yxaGH operons repressor
MTPTDTHPRERMIQSALILMGEQGVEATSFSQVIEHSGAPRGSIYHHFPGGKAQLVEEATRYAGDMVVNLLAAAVAQSQGDPRAALDAISGFWQSLLYNSDFAAGCPVVAATLENPHSPAAREAARDAFMRWEAGYTQLLQNAGVPEARARSLASIAVSGVEGAVILARAQRSNGPLERVVAELDALFRDAVEDAQRA